MTSCNFCNTDYIVHEQDYLFFRLPIFLNQVLVRRHVPLKRIFVCPCLIYTEKIIPLVGLSDHFLFWEIWSRLVLSKLSCRLRKASIFEAKAGQSIEFVDISTRYEQSVSNQIEEILMCLIHEAAQISPSILSCKAERLLLYTYSPDNSIPMWSLSLHPKPLTLPLPIHEASIWQIRFRGIQKVLSQQLKYEICYDLRPLPPLFD